MDALQATITAQAKEIVRLQARIRELEATQKPATLPEGDALIDNTLSYYHQVFYYQLLLMWSMSQVVRPPETQGTLANDMLAASKACFSAQGVGAQCPRDIIEIVKSDAAKALFVECDGSNDSLYALIKCMSKLGSTQTDAEKTVSDIARGFSDRYRADILSANHLLQDGYRGTRDLRLAIRTLRDLAAQDGAKADAVLGERVIERLTADATSPMAQAAQQPLKVTVLVGNNPSGFLSQRTASDEQSLPSEPALVDGSILCR